jgi:hypothetical protein
LGQGPQKGDAVGTEEPLLQKIQPANFPKGFEGSKETFSKVSLVGSRGNAPCYPSIFFKN